MSWVFDLTLSHRRLVSTNPKVMSGHFPVFGVEYESPKPYALRGHFKRHMTKSRFYSVKCNRSSHKAKKPKGRSFVQFGQSRHKSKFCAPRVQYKCFWSGRSLSSIFTSLVIVIKFFLGHVFILLGRLLRFVFPGIEHGSTFCFSHHSSSSSGSFEAMYSFS